MSVERLSSVIPSSTQVLASVSEWGTRLVAPLDSSLISKDGMIELAGRVYWIVPLLMIAAFVVARRCGYLTGRVTPPDSSSTNPTGVNKDFNDLLINVKEHRQLMQQVDQLDQGYYQKRGLTTPQLIQICEQIGQQKIQLEYQQQRVWKRIEQSGAIGISAGFVDDLDANFINAVRELVLLRQENRQLWKGETEEKREQEWLQIKQISQQEKKVLQLIDQHLK